MNTDTEYRAAYFLPHLDASLRGESVEMGRLERVLSQLLIDARAMGEQHVAPTQLTNWNELWNQVHTTTEALHNAVVDIRTHVEGVKGGPNATEAPEVSPQQPYGLTELFLPLRGALSYNWSSEEQEHWDALWEIIQSETAALRAHIQSVNLQLGLRQKYRTEKSSLADEVVAHRPPHASLAEVKQFGTDYQQAVKEMQIERQQTGDFRDILKAMFMYVEAPEERVRNKYRKEVEEATAVQD